MQQKRKSQMVGINPELYDLLKSKIKKKEILYSSMKSFVDEWVRYGLRNMPKLETKAIVKKRGKNDN